MWDKAFGYNLTNLHNIYFKKHIYVELFLVLLLLYCRIKVIHYIYVNKLNKNIQ